MNYLLVVQVFVRTPGGSILNRRQQVGIIHTKCHGSSRMYANTKKAPEVWRFSGDSPRPNRPAPGAQKTLTAKPLVGYLRVNSVSQLHDWNGKTDTELPEKALASAYARPS